jgi:hypothetical protein
LYVEGKKAKSVKKKTLFQVFILIVHLVVSSLLKKRKGMLRNFFILEHSVFTYLQHIQFVAYGVFSCRTNVFVVSKTHSPVTENEKQFSTVG